MMFICLLKAHPWVLTHTSSPAKRNISFHRRYMRTPVCVWMSTGEGVCMCAWRGSWGSSSLHQMKLSVGTLLSQTGTHLPMVSSKVLGEGRNKGAKRLCDNEGAPKRAFKSGTQAAWDKLCQSLRNYFLCNSEALYGHSTWGTRTQAATEGPFLSVLCFLYRADPKFVA